MCTFCGTGKGNGRNLIDEKIAKVDGLFQQQMKVLIYEKQLMKRLRDGMQV
jgi:hypothetical protein